MHECVELYIIYALCVLHCLLNDKTVIRHVLKSLLIIIIQFVKL